VIEKGVSLLGLVTVVFIPYLFYFYSSGAIEDEWDEQYLPVNRAIAAMGMGFGSLISLAVLVNAALLFQPRGIQVEHYAQ